MCNFSNTYKSVHIGGLGRWLTGERAMQTRGLEFKSSAFTEKPSVM